MSGGRADEMKVPSSNGMRSQSRNRACGGCGLANHCTGDPAEARGPFRGISLVAASLLYFLVPAFLGLVGAVIAGDGALRQLLGGAAGLLLGVLIAIFAAHRCAAVVLDREACFEPR